MDQLSKRLKFHDILCEKLGSKNVYFQPPENFKMNYPAIRYKMDRSKNDYANDKKYIKKIAYEVILIDLNPDSEYLDKIMEIDYSELNRVYAYEGLYHFVFTIYY